MFVSVPSQKVDYNRIFFGSLKISGRLIDGLIDLLCLITFFQEKTNGSKLCLPIRLEPIGFRLTWEMICAAKNNEKEMFAKLVQNATEVKNLPDNLIKSRIDEENHSLLHYLVVW